MAQKDGKKLKKETFEPVIPGRMLREPRATSKETSTSKSNRDERYLQLPVPPKKNVVEESPIVNNNRKKREESVIGRGNLDKASQSEPQSIGSTTDRAEQRALKVDPTNRMSFHCPHCSAQLRMFVTTRKKWDDNDSLSDAKEEWSGRTEE